MKTIYKVKVAHVYTDDCMTDAQTEEYIWYTESRARDFVESKREDIRNSLNEAQVIMDKPNELFVVFTKEYEHGFSTFRIEHITIEKIFV